MQQLIIQVADKEKAEMLLKIISALDFVNSVEVVEDNTNITDNQQDFFALAGMWENRNISTESIRQQAWRTEK
jgi:phosphopantetheine adenylyltransferase